MDLDLIYKLEMKYIQQEKQSKKHDVVDYFETYSENAIGRNINRMNAKYYDSYENKFID